MDQKNLVKLIVFDLDGVLVDSRPLHFHALNMALNDLNPRYTISHEEHISRYDGRSTTVKLSMLSQEKGLPLDSHGIIWKLKQEKTLELIQQFQKDNRICDVLAELKKEGYTLYCASNSIWNTIKFMLLKKGFLEYFDFFISNQEVKNSKPSPEIYLKCIDRAMLSPRECLILEDSPIGREAATLSGCHLCPVADPNDVTLQKILAYVKIAENQNAIYQISHKWRRNINVVIPMAGKGSRFSAVGYTFPKPLIEVNGKPMIQLVVENLNIEGTYTFIVQKEHYEKYCLKYLLNLIAPHCNIVCVESVTEGAACTVLLAEQFINNETPLLIANSDQYLDWDSNSFLYSMTSDSIDGGISTFESIHPKWSYVGINEQGLVEKVREKEVISKHASTGIYYWSKGSDFVKNAKQMINKNIRVKGEFYVAPVYNEAILEGKKIKIMDCNAMYGLGTPEDLNVFLMTHNDADEYDKRVVASKFPQNQASSI